MSIAPDELQKTVALLKGAPTERFIKAIESLEQRADAEEILEIKRQVRDRLAEIRPPRKINLTRIFCLPFEEMLRNTLRVDGSWIPRSAIQPCWRIVEGSAEPHVLLGMRQRLDANPRPERATIDALGHTLWDMGAKTLTAAVTAARSGDQAALALFDGDEKTVGHAEVIAAACQAATAIESLKEVFPIRPIKSLDADQREGLLEELRRLSQERRHDLRCVIYIVAHWTQNPADLFESCQDMDLGPATAIGRALMSRREKVVVARAGEQIDSLKASLEGDAVDIADCAELASIAAQCLDSAIGMVKDSKTVDQGSVTRMRQELKSMVKDKVIAAASEALGAAWDTSAQAEGLAPDREAFAAAESAARAMRKCGKMASKLGVEATVSKEIASSLAAVRQGVDQTLVGLEKGNLKEIDAARNTVANATRILEILDGPEKAYEFYREKRVTLRAQE